ncbi:response regulator [Pseudomonas sp. ICMP 460]|uniref:response regulator n=1 Tax=Pseudomonas sp. ICMP 460 TaxID=1718917 RepID=UPI000C077711|nr:response regulator [Pseudomonas sp. ICMP 460]PHN30724.1 hypothetical protein AO240_18655 [Pseudomonas sp. ICMP 460]
MTNKALRILIADSRPAERSVIENMLNRLGYHCIAAAGSYHELEALTAPPVSPFDLLIVDALLGAYEGVNVAHFCQCNPHVYHSLTYSDYRIGLVDTVPCDHQAVHASLEATPDLRSLAGLMSIIDSAPPCTGVKPLHPGQRADVRPPGAMMFSAA